MTTQPLAALRSLKVKLGVLVAVSVVVAALVGTAGRVAGVPVWLSIPVTIASALAVTQLLASGMTAPLRQMTAAARRMATGDYTARVGASSRDEVGELARAFDTMARDLADVDRQRRELIANVSHELRTPLAGLTAVLENLADGVVEPGPASLASPLAQAERMGRLVEDLLDLARVDAGAAALSAEQVEVGPFLAAVAAEPRGAERAVAVQVRVEPRDLSVVADRSRLHQLAGNLLDNAVRHSPTGGTVLLSATRVGERWQLDVRDQGPGVPAADRDRVFERFGTLSDPSLDGGAGAGTGLGLAIARWVTDLHGGTIAFLDTDGGALVRVELPLHLPQRRPDPSPAAAGSGVGATAGFPAYGGVRALLQGSDPGEVQASRHTQGNLHPHTPPVERGSLLDDLFGGLWPDRLTPARPGLLAGAAAVGALTAVVMPWRDLGFGTLLVLLAAGGVMLTASKHRRDPFTLACAALCALLVVTTIVRDAEWIVVLSVLTAGALCLVGVTRGRSLPGFLLAGLAWPVAGLRGLPWLGRTLAAVTGRGHGAAVLRAALWSVLALVVFGALFASADALVGRWVDALVPDLTVDTFVLRLFLGVAVGGTVLAAAYVALNPPHVDRGTQRARALTRRFEWLAPVLVVNAVFAAFLAAQATVVFGGHDHLRRTTGLTYAEYVHQGFGQLTVATALTLLVAGLASRRAAPGDRPWLLGSLGLLLAQTLVVVASALHRLDLYQEAYGFTRLRLLVAVFEGWLGLVVLAVLLAGLVGKAGWVPRFAVVSGAVALLVLAAINPDAWIAERNLARYTETGRVDWDYLHGLSDDAVPVFAEQPAATAACALVDRSAADGDWLEWNLGRARAAGALAGWTSAAAPRDACAAQ